MPRVLIGSIAEMRVSISFAALLVKVTASTPPGVTFPVWISQAMRVVRTRVFPEPAPARISADWSGRVTAASCSGLRFSRRFCIRAFDECPILPRSSFDEDLHSDLVRKFRELGLALQRLDRGFRVLFGCEAREAHGVDPRLPGLLRKELRGIARAAQRVVGLERIARLLESAGEDLPFPAADGHALPGLLLGFRGPLPELFERHRRHRLRHVSLEIGRASCRERV